jgi:hypothetical protein
VFSRATIDSYTAVSGLFQLQGGTTNATLLFDNVTLGGGSSHLTKHRWCPMHTEK